MSENRDIAIQITGLKKRYRLGVIGGGTLQGDIQSWWAKKRGKEDPNLKIGQKEHGKNETFMALDGIDLTVYKGERLGIIGHNGAGKSTLLKLLSRVTAPTEGKICIDGRISSMLEVGTGFNPELTGRENIYLNGAILGMSRAEVDSKIDQIIEFSECGQFIDTPVKRYSSGMYVKLAFSVSAHLDSEILIMDEVLAVGDMKFQQKCLEKMSDVSKSEGRTILYVSHNMNTIRQLCDRCMVLNHGHVEYIGDVDTAIDYYMSNSIDKEVVINLDAAERPYAHYGDKIRILNFSYLKDTSLFKFNEPIAFKLKIAFKKAYPCVRVRAEISYHDDSKIGIFESLSLRNIKEGEREFVFSFIPQMLPAGKYFVTLDIYEINNLNQHISHDHPKHNIAFEIYEDEDDKIIWNHRYMGHVRLGNLDLRETLS
jgi:ABC-type polysaccharide/polyol phosphate transport system ATPase subunit